MESSKANIEYGVSNAESRRYIFRPAMIIISLIFNIRRSSLDIFHPPLANSLSNN